MASLITVNSLHRLDTTTPEWKELQPLNQVYGPMGKHECRIVPFLQDRLAVFGGFTKNTDYTDGSGLSNELHVFNITEGMSALSVHF